MNILLSLLALILIAGCSSTPKPYETRPAGNPKVNFSNNGNPIVADPLTSEGDNYRPTFSPDGTKILFVSENREAHKSLQVYELDLNTRIERRLTFHDGDVQSVAYAADSSHVYYASSTDEIKEDPHFVRNLMKRIQRSPEETQVSRIPGTIEELEPGPFEIYASGLDGNLIRRLTRSPGFDGDISFAPKSKQLVFTSSRNKQRDIYLLGNDGNARRLTSDPYREISPTISHDGTAIAWAKLSEGLTSSQIFVGDGRTMAGGPLTSGNFFDVAPSWHPNSQELIFASDRGPAKVKNFDLYEINRSGACLKRLTESESDESFPAFSPDGRKVAFASNNSGRYQIYLMDHLPPKECSQQAP